MARTRHDGCPWEMDDGLTRLLLVVLEATCGGVEKGVGLRSRARLIGRAARGAQGQSCRAGVPMPPQLHGGVMKVTGERRREGGRGKKGSACLIQATRTPAKRSSHLPKDEMARPAGNPEPPKLPRHWLPAIGPRLANSGPGSAQCFSIRSKHHRLSPTAPSLDSLTSHGKRTDVVQGRAAAAENGASTACDVLA